MALLTAGLQAWVAPAAPALAILSIIAIFILTINLLSLCTSCHRDSFELQKDPGLERDKSSLVRVVQLEEIANKENPAINDITTDENDISIQRDGVSYKPWRNHTGYLNQSNSSRLAPVGNGTPTTTTAATTDSGTDQNIYTLPVNEAVREVESSLQAAAPAVQTENKPDSQAGAWTGPLPMPIVATTAEGDPRRAGQAASYHPYATGMPPEDRDIPSYHFVTQLDPYATSAGLASSRPAGAENLLAPPVLGEQTVGLSEESQGMYARVSKKMKCPTPPPIPPPEDEDEDSVPPLPNRD
ncbi:uncharacterized protein LOC114797378 [Denticeps clupeoides]|uniref:uncharacterized protein LOC114797378 n=1 Tax=Denticeps clupeoides TaxID=299321 RepID=UPI0010A32CEB|nr:uncharacterized protein LOC114797378 [Denticeps clupeoides]